MKIDPELSELTQRRVDKAMEDFLPKIAITHPDEIDEAWMDKVLKEGLEVAQLIINEQLLKRSKHR